MAAAGTEVCSAQFGKCSGVFCGPARRLIEYGCCKGVLGPSSGVEVSLYVRRSGVLVCRNENFDCENLIPPYIHSRREWIRCTKQVPLTVTRAVTPDPSRTRSRREWGRMWQRQPRG